MTNTKDLHRLALLNLLIDRIIDDEPNRSAENIRKALHNAVILAMTERCDTRSLQQSAAELFTDDRIHGSLPPWQ